MLANDFDPRALYDAIDAKRKERSLSWKELAAEVNRLRTRLRPISVSTITGLRKKPADEGDGILQMLLWLRRTPESFVPGMIDPMSEGFLEPQLQSGQILRWDTKFGCLLPLEQDRIAHRHEPEVAGRAADGLQDVR